MMEPPVTHITTGHLDTEIPLRARIARTVIRNAIAEEMNCRPRPHIPLIPDIPEGIFDPHHLPAAPEFEESPDSDDVCIIGAGVGGLYIAMILDFLGIKYEILESSSHAGGRILTKTLDAGPQGTHDYFDVGAMRFPKIPILWLTFDLFDTLGVTLGTYHLEGPNNPRLYNDRYWKDASNPPADKDYFQVSIKNKGAVPNDYVDKGVTKLLNDAYGPYKKALAENFDKGFAELLKEDGHSTRSFLSTRMNYPFPVVQWLETMDSATGLYDQAFTESVMDSLDFDYPEHPDWKYVDGGTTTVISEMLKTIKKTPTYGKRVTAIARSGNDAVQVSVAGESMPRQYSHAISTLPLSCLRLVDLTQAELDYAQRVAIRCLHYDSSTKVGIKFLTKWWHGSQGITGGGQGKTDEPVRVCAYPSYGIDDDPTKPAVLIASYTWAQDAQRVGSLVQGNSTSAETLLVDMVLHGLARLHDGVDYNFLKSQVVEHFAHDWYRDENAIGAFALFGPGQFVNNYPGLTRPAAGGRLHFAGEAASCHHAWVEGALSSANRVVLQMLLRNGQKKKAATVESNFKTPYEVDRVSAAWQVILGSRSAAEKS